MFGKISRTHAKPHASPQTTRLTRRTASSSTSGLEEIQQSLKSAGREKNPILKLREVHASPVFNEVLAMSQAARKAIQNLETAHTDPQARKAAAGATVCHAIDAILLLSKNYDLGPTTWLDVPKSDQQNTVQANDQAFLQQIKPAHEKQLVRDFKESWYSNNDERKAAILSALTPGVAAYLGLDVPPRLQALARSWGEIPADQQLSKSELFALVDYVNSSTGTFNAVNGSALAKAYYGDHLLAEVMQVFSTALNGAIFKLCEHPYFGKTDITVYKGINLNSFSGPFRNAMLAAAVGTGKIIASPNVLSAATAPFQSYAITKHDLGYQTECEIKMKKGFDADPFHDVQTMGEKEVIGPAGQKFIVTDRSEVSFPDPSTGGHSIVDRFVLAPAPNNAAR